MRLYGTSRLLGKGSRRFVPFSCGCRSRLHLAREPGGERACADQFDLAFVVDIEAESLERRLEHLDAGFGGAPNVSGATLSTRAAVRAT
jgi:hypothetical protein